MNSVLNPFLIIGYRSPDLFCDRITETAKLQSALSNGRNITLISYRRLGKSALIEHTFSTFPNKRKHQFIHIDIYATQNLNDFLATLSKGVFKTTYTRTQKIGSAIMDFFSRIGGSFTYDPVTGQPALDMKINSSKQTAKNIDDIFDLLEKSGKQTFIAIDEFQQILEYPEKNVEALLRTKIQKLKNVHFIFSGSHKHMLTSMFMDYSRPFYQSTDMLYLEKIKPDTYSQFIVSVFKQYKRTITLPIAQEILEWTRCHTFYVQSLCNRLYATRIKKIDAALLQQTIYELLREHDGTYYSYRNLLTQPQWELLLAIANEETAVMPTSSKFLKKYNLGSASTVNRSIKSLLNKEMIFQTSEGYLVYDVFLSRWLEQLK
jgi:uncharacterized protein